MYCSAVVQKYPLNELWMGAGGELYASPLCPKFVV